MGIENGEEFTSPSWINSEFLAEIISEDLKKDVSVINFNVKRAVPKGENYLSILYRVVVEYKQNKAENNTEKYFLIIKALPESELMQKFLTEMNGFEKESYMYTNILPAMYRIIKSAKGKVQPLSARCLPNTREHVIVLEDLKYLDYKMAMRKEGLDLDHCKIAVRTLARFHAASIALCKTDPIIKDRYREGIYREFEDEEKRIAREKHAKNSITNLVSIVQTWPGYEKYGEKLRNIIPMCTERMTEIVKPKENSFNVLNHGDCWVNNMLFHYCPITGKVDGVRFVDFQIARYSSPVLDLHYFICNCPINEVRFQHKDTLLEEYHTELSDYCKAMNLESELISLEELKEEYEGKNFFGLMTACTVLSVILAESDDMPDLKELKDGDEVNFTKNSVAGKRYREIFQKYLVYYEEKGLL